MKYYLAEEATVYTDRSTTSPVVAALQAGDQIDVAEPTAAPGEGWDVVTLPDGKTGYIPAKTKARTSPSGAQTAAPAAPIGAPPPMIPPFIPKPPTKPPSRFSVMEILSGAVGAFFLFAAVCGLLGMPNEAGKLGLLSAWVDENLGMRMDENHALALSWFCFSVVGWIFFGAARLTKRL